MVSLGLILTGIIDDLATLSGHAVAKNAFVGTKAAAAVVVDDLTVTAGVVTEDKGKKRVLTPEEQVTENLRAAAREIPVLMKIAKGSMVNKAIIIPLILGASAINPAIVGYMLTAGGAYLAYEAGEAVFEKLGWIKEHEEHKEYDNKEIVEKEQTYEELEEEKIKNAIKMDLVLSLEILIIASATIAGTSMIGSAAALSAVGVAATVGVYGVVAGIVKIDDLGMHLEKSKNIITKKIGKSLVKMMPYLLKSLSVIGTAAMAVVGGNILLEHLPMLHSVAEMVHHLPNILPYVAEMAVALSAGAVLIGAKKVISPVISYVKNKFNKITSFFKKDKKETTETTEEVMEEIKELEVDVTKITEILETNETTENMLIDETLDGTKEILSDIREVKSSITTSSKITTKLDDQEKVFDRYHSVTRTDFPDVDMTDTELELRDSSPESIEGKEFSMWTSMFDKKNPTRINASTKNKK